MKVPVGPAPSWRQRVFELPRRFLITLVKAYRLLLKPWVGNACRFEPTCSAYALQALQRHGAVAGTTLTGWRILRCHPWCAGGHDPVPENLPRPAARLFTRLGLDPVAPADLPPPPLPNRKLP